MEKPVRAAAGPGGEDAGGEAGPRVALQKVVFVDRDGTINDNVEGYVRTIFDFRLNPRAVDGLRVLSGAGFLIVVVSNQACVGDGVMSSDQFLDVHMEMVRLLKAGGVEVFKYLYCLHGKGDGCACRKPGTGLFRRFGEETGVNYMPEATYMVGDRVLDIEAARNFGLRPVLVKTGFGKFALEQIGGKMKPHAVCEDLMEAASFIIKTLGEKG